MSYTLEAVLTRAGVTGRLIAELPLASAATVIPLPQGFEMLLLTDEALDLLAPPAPGDHGPLDANAPLIAREVEALAERLSQTGPVAYVSADFWGGMGVQLAAVWDAGQLVLGPLRDDTTDPSRNSPSGWEFRKSAISQALARLGVRPALGSDEFDGLELGRCRSMERWLQWDERQTNGRG